MEIRKALSAILWLTAVFQAFAGDSLCENGFTYTIMKDGNSLSLTNYQAIDGTDYSRPLHVPASVMHESETYAVTRIGAKAFKDVTEIRSVAIDEGIEYIGKYAFECCLNLKSISIPASVESIGECLFGGCHNLISVVVDAKNECYDSRDNSNAIIDSGLDELIAACTSTKIPSSVKSIGDFAFYHCYMMEELVVPEGVERIGCDAFFGCSSLKSISLPESLTELGANAFGGCKSLKHVSLPSSVTNICDTAFKGCPFSAKQ